MRTARIAAAATILVVLAAVDEPLRAQCASAGDAPICYGLGESELIFLADVEQVQESAAGVIRVADVRFRVLERFKGVLTPDATIRFDAMQAERFSFAPGQRLLVYASRSQGRWHSGCTRTRAVTINDPEIEMLRGLTTGRPGGPVSGIVTGLIDGRQSPRSDVRLSLRGNGLELRTTAGADGVFQFDWTPPGAYELTIEGGQGYKEERRTIVVNARTGCIGLGVIAQSVP